jgi:hypothetical protein
MEKNPEQKIRLWPDDCQKVHEAHHSKLYNDALRNGFEKAEALGVSAGRKAELSCVRVQSDRPHRKTTKQTRSKAISRQFRASELSGPANG